MQLYPGSKSPRLTEPEFLHPSAKYRAAPFWGWNTRLTKDDLDRCMKEIEDMGCGGFFMHARTGLATEYLGKEFMDSVRYCVGQAREKGLSAWLYDEDRFPSGYAGGLVTRNPRHRMRTLLFTVNKLSEAGDFRAAAETGTPCLLAAFDVETDREGRLARYERIPPEARARGVKWYAYLHTQMDPEPYYNGQTYVDTLSEESIRAFLEATHERYRAECGADFGTVIPGIFTDEPTFYPKMMLKDGSSREDVHIAWTPGLENGFRELYGFDILDRIPELFWNGGSPQIHRTRYCYHDRVTELFVRAFADQCGAWCEENGILFTGHMVEEYTLYSQTRRIGEAMRSYRGFGLPGVDMLCHNVEWSTLKQAQSVSRQRGKEGVLGEIYGAMNWDVTFADMKYLGDLYACGGVTQRVPHHHLTTLRGEAKRDHPPFFGSQSPWIKEYAALENHFARLSAVLTRGKPDVRVAVVHPIESFWMYWGSEAESEAALDLRNGRFLALTEWLTQACIDFDFLCEATLPADYREGGEGLRVGEMRYGCVVIPGCDTLRASTAEILMKFAGRGGRLVILGEPPVYTDALPNPPALGACKQVPFTRQAVEETLDEYRFCRIPPAQGRFAGQLRREKDCGWLFLTRCVPEGEPWDPLRVRELSFTVSGACQPKLWDTLSGTVRALPFKIGEQGTAVTAEIADRGSILVQLLPLESPAEKPAPPRRLEPEKAIALEPAVRVIAHEPNVLLLDRAAYALDDEPYRKTEDILRLDNALRERLGYFLRCDQIPQPWIDPDAAADHSLRLRFEVVCGEALTGALLALESAGQTRIFLNGAAVPNETRGFYADRAIETVPLPPLRKGLNRIETVSPFGMFTNTEACYLLGDFSVRMQNGNPVTDQPGPMTGFGDISQMGYPFYGGDLTYEMHFTLEEPLHLELRMNAFTGPCARVFLDGTDAGLIGLEPLTAVVPHVAAGRHSLKILHYGNRFNTFAALHHADPSVRWCGPNWWRSKGAQWTDSYRVRPTGILEPPALFGRRPSFQDCKGES